MSIDNSKHQSLAEEFLPVPQHLVGGDWSTSAIGGSRPHVNPGTGDVQATIPMSDESEVDDAVAAAKRAAGPRRDLPPNERQSLLVALARLVEKNSSQLATSGHMTWPADSRPGLSPSMASKGAVTGAASAFNSEKASGFGREDGKAGVEEFISSKNVYLGF
jgi:acyl-CoA reductase-like NAD-dependent aldehyde dehydrogenase